LGAGVFATNALRHEAIEGPGPQGQLELTEAGMHPPGTILAKAPEALPNGNGGLLVY
jgi:hypothetical protein